MRHYFIKSRIQCYFREASLGLTGAELCSCSSLVVTVFSLATALSTFQGGGHVLHSRKRKQKDSGNKVVVQRQGLGAGPDRMTREGLEEIAFELRPER